MKKLLSVGILLSAALCSAATIVTTRGVTKAFPNPIRRVYEQPLFVLEKGDVVEVLQWGKPLTKIRNRKGRTGWVEIGLLDSLKRPPILTLVIDSSDAGTDPKTSNPNAKVSVPKKPLIKAVESAPEKEGEAVVKKWVPVKDTAKQAIQKPVDFQGDSSHISPPVKVDSAK
ncbi:MAG TPA: hypothetical protein PKO15_07055 [Fibrobacteria bacterium]|nr:hypothetical protein [Fibrobacteria bacterium]